jgi:hypothetical protein
LLRVFPKWWRERYGDELAELIREVGLSPRVAIDAARIGVSVRIQSIRAYVIGGEAMSIGPAWRHPTASAVIGLVLLAPTLTLIALSVPTPYQLARVGLADFASSLHAFLNVNRAADLFLVGAPALTLLFSAIPLVRVSVLTGDGERLASFGVRLRWINIFVALMALLVGGLLVTHIMFESVMQVGA